MSHQIRILDLRENPFIGGPSKGLFTTYNEIMSRSDIRVFNCVLARNEVGWMFERAAIDRIQLDRIHCSGPSDFRVLRRLRDYIISNNIDIVHTRGYRGDIYTRLLLNMKQISTPHVITKHGVQSSSHWRIKLYAKLDKWPLRRANHVIAVDSATHAMLLKWNVSCKKLTTIYNPAPDYKSVSEEVLSQLKGELSIDHCDPIIAFIGRIEQEKGIFDLVQAHELLFKKAQKSYLLFIGSGSHEPELQIKAEQTIGAKHIRFLGTKLNVDPYLAVADIVVLPSYKEGMPNTILEAMTAGKPVVATQVGGIPELIKDSYNGLLFSPGAVDQLAEKLGYLLKYRDISKQMGSRSQAIVNEKFSVSQTVDSIIKVYKRMTK